VRIRVYSGRRWGAGSSFQRCFPIQVAETFTGTGIVQPDIFRGKSDRLEQVQRAEIDTVLGLDRSFEKEPNGRLAGEIIDFVRLRLEQDLEDATKVVESDRF
jgi:hypothetical protein